MFYEKNVVILLLNYDIMECVLTIDCLKYSLAHINTYKLKYLSTHTVLNKKYLTGSVIERNWEHNNTTEERGASEHARTQIIGNPGI